MTLLGWPLVGLLGSLAVGLTTPRQLASSGREADLLQLEEALAESGWVRREDGDIAILAAEAPGLTALAWGGEVSEGVGIAVAGYPLGQGERASIAAGIVSRVFADEAGVTQLQTDAPTNAGNSGGPLVDACGRVVGVASWKFAQDNRGVATDGLASSSPSRVWARR